MLQIARECSFDNFTFQDKSFCSLSYTILSETSTHEMFSCAAVVWIGKSNFILTWIYLCESLVLRWVEYKLCFEQANDSHKQQNIVHNSPIAWQASIRRRSLFCCIVVYKSGRMSINDKGIYCFLQVTTGKNSVITIQNSAVRESNGW